MDFKGKKLEDIVVTLPFVNGKVYFALLPLKSEKELDFSARYMLYEVVEDEEHNPVVMYIGDDVEYAIAAQYFSDLIAKK